MKRLEWTSLFFMGFSVLVAVLSVQAGIGKLQVMGAGFVPFLASFVLFCLSLVVVILEAKKKSTDEKEKRSGGPSNLRKPAMLLAALAAYAFLLRPVGYLITTSAIMFSMLSMTEQKKWWRDAILAIVVAVCSFIFFGKWLRLQLPAGLFGL